jgi:inhibitor of cysteine peptidase
VTDNAGVFIQSWTCNENTLEEITLGPGDVYSKNIILYIPKTDKTGPVTFRLGFKRMSENGDISEPLWSDPVTMEVIVPDEMKEAVPSEVSKNPSQISEQTQEKSVEANAVPSAASSSPVVPEGSQPLVFQDPGVPINVFSGEEFSIALVSTPSTGFGWKMTLPEDQKAVKFLESGYVASQNAMPGAPGEEVYKFKAVTPGEIKADFVYERPWETQTAPTRKIFTILVQENQ